MQGVLNQPFERQARVYKEERTGSRPTLGVQQDLKDCVSFSKQVGRILYRKHSV